jgi:dihydroflavonol-4-reductase
VLKTNIDLGTNESAPYAENTQDKYFQSKIFAEKEVRQFLDSHPSMRIIFILPSVMLGPGDRGPTPTGSFIQNVMNGKVKFLLPGTMKIVDVRDVAETVVKCIEKGESGERYLVGGRAYPIKEIIRTVCTANNIKSPSKSISAGKILFIARVMQLMSQISGKPAELKPHIIKRLQKNFWYDSSKAKKTFGIEFRPIKETLEDTVHWFQTSQVEIR